MRLPHQTLSQWFAALTEYLEPADISRLRLELERECYVFGATPAQAAVIARMDWKAKNIIPAGPFAWVASLPLSVQAPWLCDDAENGAPNAPEMPGSWQGMDNEGGHVSD